MYELVHVKGNSYYMQSPAKIGLVKLRDDSVCLLDSGSDKEAGRYAPEVMPEGFEVIPLPGHFFSMEDITELAQLNIDKVNEIADRIAGICREAGLRAYFADNLLLWEAV